MSMEEWVIALETHKASKLFGSCLPRWDEKRSQGLLITDGHWRHHADETVPKYNMFNGASPALTQLITERSSLVARTKF